MSQNPTIQKKSSGIDFTKTIRNDTYDFVKPEQFDLSTRSILVTGASKVKTTLSVSHVRAQRRLALQHAQDWMMLQCN